MTCLAALTAAGAGLKRLPGFDHGPANLRSGDGGESCRGFVVTRRDGQGSPDYGNRAWAPGRAEAKGSRGDA